MSELPEGWRCSSVGRVLRLRYGKALSPGLRNPQGVVPVIGSAGPMTGTGAALVGGPSIVIGRKGNVGAVQLMEGPSWPIDTTFYAEIPQDIHPRFLALQLRRLNMRRLDSSTTTPSLRREDLEAEAVVLPPLDEQRRIVEILEDHLSRLDAAEAALRRSGRRTALLERAVIDRVFATEAQAAGWPTLALEDCARDEPRAITDGPFGSNLTSAHYKPHGARVVRLQNIGDGTFKLADAFISIEHYETLTSHEVRQGDLVIASLGDRLPRAAVVPDLGGPAIVKADCIRLRVREGIEPEWLALACRATGTKRWAEQRLHGMGRQRLGLAGIREIPIPFPDARVRHERLDRINQLLEGAQRLSTSMSVVVERLRAVRRAALEAAFSGRLTGHASDADLLEEMAAGA